MNLTYNALNQPVQAEIATAQDSFEPALSEVEGEVERVAYAEACPEPVEGTTTASGLRKPSMHRMPA